MPHAIPSPHLQVILKQFYLPNLKVASILLCLAFVYGAAPCMAVNPLQQA